MEKSAGILLIFILIVVVVIVCILVFSPKTRDKVLQLEKKETHEGFLGEDHSSWGFVPNMPCKDPHLIPGGDFIDPKHPQGHIPGHNCQNVEITQMTNPGNGSYVLVLSPNKIDENSAESQCMLVKYCIHVDIEPGKFYVLSTWVKDLKESSKNLFSLVFDTCDGQYRLDTIGVQVMESQTASGEKSRSGWQRRSVIFQVPSKAKKRMVLCLLYQPKVGIGNRFITGINMDPYHPQLHCYPIQKDLRFFLSILHSNSYDANTRIWKDLSGNGNSFKLTSNNVDCTKGFSLNKTRYEGPCCSKLKFQPLNFALGFVIKVNNLDCNGVVLFRLDTSLENNNSILVIFRKDKICCSYTQVTVKFLGHKKTFNIGYSNYLANYIVNVEGGNISLYKDGVFMSAVPNPDLAKNGWWVKLSEPEKMSYFSNKPFLINPNKACIDGIIYTTFLHCRSLTNLEISQIYYYFTFIFSYFFDRKTYKCLINNACKSPEDALVQKFPFKPYTEYDIITPNKEVCIKTQKLRVQEKQDFDKCKYDQKVCDAKLKHMEIVAEGEAVKQKSIGETQELLSALVKAFNAKETDKVAPQCGKTSYRISKAPQNSKNQYHVIRTVQANNPPKGKLGLPTPQQGYANRPITSITKTECQQDINPDEDDEDDDDDDDEDEEECDN